MDASKRVDEDMARSVCRGWEWVEVEKDIERVEDEKRLSSTLSTALVPSLAFIDVPYM